MTKSVFFSVMVAAVASFGLFEATEASAAKNPRFLCANQSGAIRTRYRCRADEIKLDLPAISAAVGAQQGAQGEKGDPGPQGAPGISGFETLAENFSLNLAGFGVGAKTLGCPTGKVAVSGGCDTTTAGFFLQSSKAFDLTNPSAPASWICSWRNSGAAATGDVQVQVTCADINS